MDLFLCADAKTSSTSSLTATDAGIRVLELRIDGIIAPKKFRLAAKCSIMPKREVEYSYIQMP